MDTLSHGLWALAIFWGTSYRWWAFLIGMAPDLLSFGPFFVQRILTGTLSAGRPDHASIPSYVPVAYNVTHSILFWVLVGALLYVVARRYWPIVGAALAHIALDIPTHNSFYPTPFLWPFSDYRFHGISWGTPWVFALNWICLTVLFSLIWYHEWSKRRAAPTPLVRQEAPAVPAQAKRKKK